MSCVYTYKIYIYNIYITTLREYVCMVKCVFHFSMCKPVDNLVAGGRSQLLKVMFVIFNPVWIFFTTHVCTYP